MADLAGGAMKRLMALLALSLALTAVGVTAAAQPASAVVERASLQGL